MMIKLVKKRNVKDKREWDTDDGRANWHKFIQVKRSYVCVFIYCEKGQYPPFD